MSVNIERRVVDPGDDAFLEAAWDLKETIRRAEGVLKQRRGFFSQAYRRATVYLFFEPDSEVIAGFAAARRDGYILFLAVDPDHRGKGFGERLVAQVADNHRRVTCHARTTNENAIAFYRHLGFDVVRRIDNYYEDGGDAFYLRLGEPESLTDRLAAFLRR